MKVSAIISLGIVLLAISLDSAGKNQITDLQKVQKALDTFSFQINQSIKQSNLVEMDKHYDLNVNYVYRQGIIISIESMRKSEPSRDKNNQIQVKTDSYKTESNLSDDIDTKLKDLTLEARHNSHEAFQLREKFKQLHKASKNNQQDLKIAEQLKEVRIRSEKIEAERQSIKHEIEKLKQEKLNLQKPLRNKSKIHESNLADTSELFPVIKKSLCEFGDLFSAFNPEESITLMHIESIDSGSKKTYGTNLKISQFYQCHQQQKSSQTLYGEKFSY